MDDYSFTVACTFVSKTDICGGGINFDKTTSVHWREINQVTHKTYKIVKSTVYVLFMFMCKTPTETNKEIHPKWKIMSFCSKPV